VEWLGRISDYWWLVFVFGGSIGAAVRGVSTWNERRAQRRLERYRIKQQTKIALARAEGRGRVNAAAVRRELNAIVAKHEGIDKRWFDYETDLATILDFPMMIDLREPLTVGFHTARSHAELLRPEPVEALLTDIDALHEYRDAVHAYAASFDVAEREAKRRRRGDFSPLEQDRLAKAQRLLALAMDEGAAPTERQQAYARARKELDGLIDLPRPGTAELEQRMRAALGPGER
jgi:hypothetical protein